VATPHFIDAEERNQMPDDFINLSSAPSYLAYLHKRSTNNKGILTLRPKCGCFYCLKVMASNDIHKFTDDNTAVCPHCGIDSILPGCLFNDDEDMKESMTKMHKQYFEKTYEE
jgi:hypothetical protein